MPLTALLLRCTKPFVLTRFDQRPRFLIRHDSFVLGFPVSVNPVPAVALEYVRAFRANLPTNCIVRGRITDATGMPVRGAVVHFERLNKNKMYQIKTDKDGVYGHYGLPKGNYRISAFTSDGQLIDQREAFLLPAGETRMDFVVKQNAP